MTAHFMTPLKLDRISMTVVIGDKILYDQLQVKFYTMKKMQDQLLPHGQINIKPELYMLRLDYYATYKKPDRRKIADITIGTNKLFGNEALHRYFKLTLYPSQFKGDDFTHFKEALKLIFPDLNYEKLYHTGKVNYLELAVDSLTHKHHSFLPLRKYCSDSWIYTRKDGTLGTTYLGDKTSNMRTRIYDKRRQLKDTGRPIPYPQHPAHTRIEAVMRRLPYTPATLIQMKNQFKNFLIVDLTKAESKANDPDWQAFISSAKTIGLPEALSQIPQRRKNYLKELQKLQVNWFNSAKIWLGLLDALAVIAP